MKLQHIVRDSSANLFYLDNTSVSNHYPVLKLNAVEVDFINVSGTVGTDTDYFNREFDKILTYENLLSISERFYTNQVRSSVSKRLKVQADEFKTYLTVDSVTSQFIDSNFLNFNSAQQTIIQNKAVSLGYSTSIDDESSIREVHRYDTSGQVVSFDDILIESYNPRVDLSIDGIYTAVEEIDLFWRKLKEQINIDGDYISLDLSTTFGSVMPVFGDIEYQEGYNLVSASIMYEEVATTDVYKETINIHADTTCASLNSLGVQIIWVKPNTPYSLIKIVWDPELIKTARITNIKLSKLNNNE